MGCWEFDQHTMSRHVVLSKTDPTKKVVANEGFFRSRDGLESWYDVPFGVMVPKRGQASNLLVPVAISVSSVVRRLCPLAHSSTMLACAMCFLFRFVLQPVHSPFTRDAPHLAAALGFPRRMTFAVLLLMRALANLAVAVAVNGNINGPTLHDPACNLRPASYAAGVLFCADREHVHGPGFSCRRCSCASVRCTYNYWRQCWHMPNNTSPGYKRHCGARRAPERLRSILPRSAKARGP